MDQQSPPPRHSIPPPTPPRIQHIIQVLLEHQQQICHYPTGTLEIHFHHGSVKAKLTLHLPS
jgi:hypothetical protein